MSDHPSAPDDLRAEAVEAGVRVLMADEHDSFTDLSRAVLAAALPVLAAGRDGQVEDGPLDVDLRGPLASNALCAAADRRGLAYDVNGEVADEQLARADADFVTEVEHVVGTYCASAQTEELQSEIGRLDHIASLLKTQRDEARAEVERLRGRITHLERTIEPCTCNMNPNTTDGPDEYCPQHGRPYSYILEYGDKMRAERDEAREQLAVERGKVAAVLDEFVRNEGGEGVTHTEARIMHEVVTEIREAFDLADPGQWEAEDHDWQWRYADHGGGGTYCTRCGIWAGKSRKGDTCPARADRVADGGEE